MRVKIVPLRQRRLSASSRSKVLLFFVAMALYCPLLRIRLHGESRNEAEDIQRISKLAEELCARLQLSVKVDVVIVDENKFGVSVEPLVNVDREYKLSFDRKLYESFTSEELTAAVAHEMGHVWIYKHHPYLQTEALANEVALRLVSRDTLKDVYSKLWHRLGITGNLEEVLGPEQPAGVQHAAVNLN